MPDPIKADLEALEAELFALQRDRNWMHTATRCSPFSKWIATLRAEVEAAIQSLKSIEKKKLEKAQAVISATEDLIARLLSAYEPEVANKEAEIKAIKSNHPLLIAAAHGPVDAGPDSAEAPGPDSAEAPGPDPAEAPGPDPAEAPGPDPAEAPGPDSAEAPGSDPAEAPGPVPAANKTSGSDRVTFIYPGPEIAKKSRKPRKTSPSKRGMIKSRQSRKK